MTVWTYRFIDSDIPAEIGAERFRAEVARAMRYVEQASGERVRFLPATFLADAGVKLAGNVNIGFDPTLKAGEVGQQWSNKKADGRVVHSIAFDPKLKWITRWWHKWITNRYDLYTVAVHELGHLLGLAHNDLPWDESVMSEGARFHQFSDREIEQLKRLLA